MRIAITASPEVVSAGLEALISATPGWELADPLAMPGPPDVLVTTHPVGELTGGPAAVLLTPEAQPEWTSEAVRAGVRALLPRDVSAAVILAAVEAAGNGMALIDPRELDGLLGSAPIADTAVTDTADTPLTPREMEVLRMLAEGAANKEIAWRLGISEHTVKFHVASVMGKLNAASRTEAVTRGLRRGLILM